MLTKYNNNINRNRQNKKIMSPLNSDEQNEEKSWSWWSDDEHRQIDFKETDRLFKNK